ncbi:hypothetical protein BDR03DRAFT_980858 [Suillus americanus]|nr:hypothetical protein BDR03DRAFT_980858 [Suillus americanus]
MPNLKIYAPIPIVALSSGGGIHSRTPLLKLPKFQLWARGVLCENLVSTTGHSKPHSSRQYEHHTWLPSVGHFQMLRMTVRHYLARLSPFDCCGLIFALGAPHEASTFEDQPNFILDTVASLHTTHPYFSATVVFKQIWALLVLVQKILSFLEGHPVSAMSSFLPTCSTEQCWPSKASDSGGMRSIVVVQPQPVVEPYIPEQGVIITVHTLPWILLYELDKILHLLWDCSKNLDLLGIRLMWEEQCRTAWSGHQKILADISFSSTSVDMVFDWDKLSSNDHVGDIWLDVGKLVRDAPQSDPQMGLYAHVCRENDAEGEGREMNFALDGGEGDALGGKA